MLYFVTRLLLGLILIVRVLRPKQLLDGCG
jgi:hypothetical protein